jgi:acyl carrier protein
MTIEELYAQVSPIATQIFGISRFGSAVNMHSTPEWDSLNHVRLLSAMEKKFSIEIGADEDFKLT